jgi:hypothetical protein
VLIGSGVAALTLLTARWLRARVHRKRCLLTSALNCVHFPLGTLLAAFTVIVLCRPTVRAAFQSQGGASERPSSL